MKKFKYIQYSILVLVIWPVIARAQGVTTAGATVVGNPSPLPPPSILNTNTGLGWIDMLLKSFPYVWAIFGPVVLGTIQQKAPKFIEKIPRSMLPAIVSVWGSIGGLMAGVGSLGLDGGGVSIDSGMFQGAGTGLLVQGTLQKSADKVVPVLTKEETKG